MKHAYKIPLLGVLLIAGCMLLLFPPTSYAAEQKIRVSPVIINVALSPGKTASHTATIENLTTSPLPLRASLNDFLTSGEEGGYIFEQTKENPLLSWITLSEENLILKPKEKRTITLKITTPKNIPVGGYYGILFYEPVLQNTSEATQVNAKIGTLLLANIGVPDPKAKKAEILTFTPNTFSFDGTVPFILRVKNVALNFFTAKPILHITPLFPTGKDIKPVYVEEKIIFPGKVRRWNADHAVQNLSPNIYKVLLLVSTGGGQGETVSQYIIVFPEKQILLFIGGLLMVIVIMLMRKRLTKAAIALFRS